MVTNRRRINIPMMLACILLCCVMISFHFVSNLYARYSTTTSANTSARVAKFNFDIKVDSNDFNKTLHLKIPDFEKEEVILTINNTSEVALTYTITVRNESKNIPLVFTIDEKTNKDECIVTNNIDPNDTGMIHKLSFTWEDVNVADHYMGLVDLISLTVDVKQID